MSYPFVAGELPNTEWAANRFISLPCGHLVDLDDIAKIAFFLRLIRRDATAIRARMGSAKSDRHLPSNELSA